jgi:hypothetical protein
MEADIYVGDEVGEMMDEMGMPGSVVWDEIDQYADEVKTEKGSVVTLPMDLTSPGSVRVPCPLGMRGSVVLLCASGELRVATETCEPMPQGICSAVGNVCGDPGACTDSLPAARCAAVQRRGRCSVPQFATGCCHTCNSDGTE